MVIFSASAISFCIISGILAWRLWYSRYSCCRRSSQILPIFDYMNPDQSITYAVKHQDSPPRLHLHIDGSLSSIDAPACLRLPHRGDSSPRSQSVHHPNPRCSPEAPITKSETLRFPIPVLLDVHRLDARYGQSMPYNATYRKPTRDLSAGGIASETSRSLASAWDHPEHRDLFAFIPIVTTPVKATMAYTRMVPTWHAISPAIPTISSNNLAQYHTDDLSPNAAGCPNQRPTTHHYHAWLKNVPKPVWLPDGISSVDERSSTSDEDTLQVSGGQGHRVELIEASNQAPRPGGKPGIAHAKGAIAKTECVIAIEKVTEMGIFRAESRPYPPPLQPHAHLRKTRKSQPRSSENAIPCLPPLDDPTVSSKVGSTTAEDPPSLDGTSFSFDTKVPDLEFTLQFVTRMDTNVEIVKRTSGGVALGSRDAENRCHAPKEEFLEHSEPSITTEKPTSSSLRLRVSPAITDKSPGPYGPTHGAPQQQLYTPVLQETKCASLHSASRSDASSASMLSWLPIRDPLTPRFNHLREVLEGNRGMNDAHAHWPPVQGMESRDKRDEGRR